MIKNENTTLIEPETLGAIAAKLSDQAYIEDNEEVDMLVLGSRSRYSSSLLLVSILTSSYKQENGMMVALNTKYSTYVPIDLSVCQSIGNYDYSVDVDITSNFQMTVKSGY